MPFIAYLPELASVTQQLQAKQDPVNYINWNDVLVRELASHMAGIAMDFLAFLTCKSLTALWFLQMASTTFSI